MLTDTHCHLDFPHYKDDLDDVIDRAKEGGLAFIVNVGSSLESSRNSVDISQTHDFIYSSVGLHPHEAEISFDTQLSDVRDISGSNKVVAIGECGLDYYREHNKDKQRALFIEQIRIAQEKNLPLIIHTRDAGEEVLDILEKEFKNNKISGVIHCFSETEGFLNRCPAQCRNQQ